LVGSVVDDPLLPPDDELEPPPLAVPLGVPGVVPLGVA